MDTDRIKLNLKKYYDQEAPIRDSGDKEEWKKVQRNRFFTYIEAENKKSLLEIGAGTGDDSRYFKSCGLDVTAVDLSHEMIRLCKAKGIDAYELDFYSLSDLGRKFDCVWSMNSLLHVPKRDMPMVLKGIHAVLKDDGIFYMGVYGGVDAENSYVNEFSDIPRFFSYYSARTLYDTLGKSFDILEYQQIDVGRNTDFQSVIMRKTNNLQR